MAHRFAQRHSARCSNFFVPIPCEDVELRELHCCFYFFVTHNLISFYLFYNAKVRKNLETTKRFRDFNIYSNSHSINLDCIYSVGVINQEASLDKSSSTYSYV